ncbi:MAG: 1-acyl-sn-glycerol-3-phosphate acyltransferase [Streptosporangiales bacterium]|nr:1-acyl-sn-glycerol-3-phosphate acyltransferase [Streptosporangiales bacterium]
MPGSGTAGADLGRDRPPIGVFRPWPRGGDLGRPGQGHVPYAVRGAKEGAAVLYRILRRIVRTLVLVGCRPVIEGVENLPATGPVIVAGNHLSFMDSVLIPAIALRRMTFLAKAEYFEGSGLGGTLSRWFFTSMGHVPVPRTGRRASLQSLELALEVLRRGGAFGIYPEGSRSPDGRLYRARTGVGYLALASGAPVVPVGLVGTAELMPIGARLPRLRRFTLRFGAPLDFSEHLGQERSARLRRQVADEVMEAIGALSGQERAGVYNERAEA